MARDLNLEKTWRERVRRFEESGLTTSQFCEQEGLVSHQLSWWRSELKRRAAESAPPVSKTKNIRRRIGGSPKPAKAAGFLPVELSHSTHGSSVEIILDQPPRIAVSAGFDASLLQQVLRVLESR